MALLTGVPAVITALITQIGVLWTLATISAATAILVTWPGAQLWLLAHAWCVITAHRVRTGCAQAWIHSRYGKLPIILLTTPRPFGESVYIWCRAGVCLADFTAGTDILRASCWAHDIRVTSSARYSHIVILDVIRRETPADNQAPA